MEDGFPLRQIGLIRDVERDMEHVRKQISVISNAFHVSPILLKA